MEQEAYISLDPDVIKNNDDGRISLSSLYGFSVFSETAEEYADEQETITKKRIEQIDREIFLTSEDKETERMEKIYNQIFRTEPGLRITAEAGVQEDDRKSSDMLPVFGAIVIVILLFYFMKRSGEMRRWRK